MTGAVCWDEGPHAGGLAQSLASGQRGEPADPASQRSGRFEGVAANDTHQQQIDERPERVQARPHLAGSAAH